MGASITFNVDKLIKELDLIEKVHIPKAAEQALRSFGFDMRKLLQQEMQREEKIEGRCEFCNAVYQFAPAEIFGDMAADTGGDINGER